MEPIPPEAYLAIAAGAHKAVTKYKDRRVYKKNEKIRKLESGSTSTGWTSTTTTDASSTSSSRSLEELLDQNGLVMSQDGYLEWSMSSPDYPRNWGSVRKMFDLGLLVWLGFLMAMGSSVGTPASSYALQTFHVSKTVAVLGFTTMLVQKVDQKPQDYGTNRCIDTLLAKDSAVCYSRRTRKPLDGRGFISPPRSFTASSVSPLRRLQTLQPCSSDDSSLALFLRYQLFSFVALSETSSMAKGGAGPCSSRR